MVRTPLMVPLLVFACGGGGEEASTRDVDPATWHGGVAAVVRGRCGGCHVAGGSAPFALDTPEAFALRADEAMESMRQGRMPPWQPDPSCREYADQRVVPRAERDLLDAWVRAGQPLGAAAAPPPTSAEGAADFGPADVVASTPRPYTPDVTRPDDYRCFLLDAEFPEGAFVEGLETLPGDPALVHHVLFFLITARDVPKAEAAVVGDPDPGYRCFGGPGIDNATQTLAGWAPGMQPARLPEGSALRIPPGGRIVMQVHYNTLSAVPAPDRTSLHLWLRDEPPEFLSMPKPLANIMFDLPAGQGRSVWEETFTNYGDTPWVVTGVAPHMHLLGRWIRVDVLNERGEERGCLVDVPDWDFGWQQFYEFRPGEEVEIDPGEAVRLTCAYDNSAEAQPVVNGERLPSRDVSWGGGTLDEMCLNFLVVRTPYDATAPDATPCAGADLCMRNCDPDDPVCHLACASAAPGGCPECVTLRLAGCGGRLCEAEVDALAPCLQPCYFGGGEDLAECLESQCGPQLNEFWGCFQPPLYAGECNAEFAECNLAF